MFQVSVVILAYNKVNYIAECIEGALMQNTSFPVEILIGEDDSTDGTREICQEYAEKYPNQIKLALRSESEKVEVLGRKSMHKNFVETMNLAQGKYIAYCDGDDYWTDPYKLQKQVDFLEENSNYALCYHNCRILDQDGSDSTLFSENSSGDFSFEHSLQYKNGPASSIVVKQEVVKKFDFWLYINQIIYQDWALEILALSLGKGYFFEEVMGMYRVVTGSVSSFGSGLAHINMRINLLEEVLAQKSIPNKESAIHAALERWYLRRMNHYVKRGQFGLSFLDWLKAMKHLRFDKLNIVWYHNLDRKNLYKWFFKYRIAGGVKALFS